MIRRYTTNLRCGACLARVAPLLDAADGIKRWTVDLAAPGRPLSAEGERVGRAEIDALLAPAGYATTGELAPDPAPATAAGPEVGGKPPSYAPLAVVVGYLVGTIGLIELSSGEFDRHRAMLNLMAGFFLVFSAFKLLDLRGFADSYATYDVLARRSRLYALAYPFIELALGAAYLARFQLPITNAATFAVMLLSLVGVAQTVLSGRKIRCACLGAGFNLPMSSVTLVEDGAMALMAGAMLVLG